MPAVLVDAVSQGVQEPMPSSERTCPRCGRPVQRRRQAKWCSDTCKVRAYEKRRTERANNPGGSQDPTPPVEPKETVTVTGSRGMWERSPVTPETAQASSNGNGAGATEAAVAAVREALSRRLRVGAEDAILRRVRSLLTRRPQ